MAQGEGAGPEAIGEPLGPTLGQQLLENRLEEDVRAAFDAAHAGLSDLYTKDAEDWSLDPKAREAALTYAVAEGHLFDEEADEAFVCGTDALNMFQKMGDSVGVSDALRVVIASYRAKGQSDAAMTMAKEELEKCKKKGDKRGEASMLMAIAEAKLAQDCAEEALTALADAAARFKEAKDKKMEASALLVYLKACAKKDRLEEALKAGNDAMALFKEVKDQKGEGKAHLGLATAHLVAGGLTEGLKAAEAALEIFKKTESKKLEVAAMLMIADVYLLKEWARQASQMAQRALTMCRELDYSRGEGIAVNTLALALCAKGDTKAARLIAEESLDKFHKKRDKNGVIATRNALVHIYLEKDEPDEALAHAEKERELLGAPAEKRRHAAVQLTIALLHCRRGEGLDAVEVAMDALKAYKEMQDTMGEGMATYVLVYANLAYEDPDVAVTHANEALKIFKSPTGHDARRWEAGTLVALSTAMAAAKAAAQEGGNVDYEEAIAVAKDAQVVYNDIGDKKGWAAAEMKIAEMHFMNHEANAAIASTNEALERLDEVGHRKGQACALHFQAAIELAKGLPDEALNRTMEARRRCRRVEERKGEALLLQTITRTYFEKYTKAVDDLAERARASENEARKLREANRKAFKAAKDALGLAKRNDNRELMGTSLVQVTRCHLVNGRVEKAIKSSEEAIELLHEVNDKKQEAMAVALNAEALMGQNEKEKAAAGAKRAVFLARAARDAGAEHYAIQVMDAIFAEETRKAPAVAAIEATASDSADIAPEAASSIVEEKAPTLNIEDVLAMVGKAAVDTAGEDEIANDTSLMDAGLDSLSSVAFRNMLTKQLPGIKLPSSLMFDYPSINQITDFIVEESARRK